MNLGDADRSVQPVASLALTLHEIPFELLPREVPFLLCNTPASLSVTANSSERSHIGQFRTFASVWLNRK